MTEERSRRALTARKSLQAYGGTSWAARRRQAGGILAAVALLGVFPGRILAQDGPKGRLAALEGGALRLCTDERPCAPGSPRGIWWELAVAQDLQKAYLEVVELRAIIAGFEAKEVVIARGRDMWREQYTALAERDEELAMDSVAAHESARLANDRADRAVRATLWWLLGGVAIALGGVGLGAAL